MRDGFALGGAGPYHWDDLLCLPLDIEEPRKRKVMKANNDPKDAVMFGVDVGRNVFHVVGFDAAGIPIQQATFRPRLY